jgi:hypothetical protein
MSMANILRAGEWLCDTGQCLDYATILRSVRWAVEKTPKKSTRPPKPGELPHQLGERLQTLTIKPNCTRDLRTTQPALQNANPIDTRRAGAKQ